MIKGWFIYYRDCTLQPLQPQIFVNRNFIRMSDQQLRSTMPNFRPSPAPRQQDDEIIYHIEEDEDVLSQDAPPSENVRKKKKRRYQNQEEDDAPPLQVKIQSSANTYPSLAASTATLPPGAQVQTYQRLIEPETDSPTKLMSTANENFGTADVFKPMSPVKPPRPQLEPSKTITDRDMMKSTEGFLLQSKKISNEYKIARYPLAEDFFYKMSYRYKDNTGGYEEYGVCSDNDELKKYGMGVYLYLEMLKHMAVMFIFMAICAGIMMYNNYASNGLYGYPESYTLNLVKTSLGNNINKTQETVFVHTILSGLISLFCLIFVFHWRRMSNKIVAENEQSIQEIDSQKYILVFSGINSSHPNTDRIKRFIEKSYPIYEVSIIYDYKRKFDEIMDLEEIKHEMESEKILMKEAGQLDAEKIKKLEDQFNEKHKELLEENLSRLPKYLIVHFERISDKIVYENLFTKRHLVNTFGQKFLKCMTCSDPLPLNYRYDINDEWLIDHIKLGKPDDIIWQNMDIGPLQWLIRRIIGIIFILISLFITSSIICLSTLYIATTSSCVSYVPITFAQAQLTSDQNTLFCYCQSEIYAGLTDQTVKTLCQSLTSKIIYTNALQIVAALVSSITNLMLEFLISKIVKFMKPKSKSTQYSNLFIFNFLAVLLNSFVLPLLINASIFGTKPILYVSFLNFFDLTKVSLYSDFEKSWYVYIAPYYMNLIIISILMPIIDLIKVSIMQSCKRSSLSGKDGKILQKEMNASIVSFEFDLPIKLSSMLVNIFIVMLYSANLPILVMLEIAALVSAYLCNKKIILKFSARITANEQLNFSMLNVFPFILLFNLAFSIWELTSPDIFPSALFSRIRFNFITLNNSWDRTFYISFITVMLFIALAYIVLDYTLVVFLKAICVCDCWKGNTVAPITAEKPYSEKIKTENIIASYKMGKNPHYKAVSQIADEIFALQLAQEMTSKIANNSLMSQI